MPNSKAATGADLINAQQVMQELNTLRRGQFWLSVALITSAALFASICLLQAHQIRLLQHQDHLVLRRLDIVDDQGKSRVILAAPLPPPFRFGKVGHRDGPVSGILIADSTGTERGGYVTSEGKQANALLTLDAQGRQTVLLLAEPDGSTLFRLWDQQKGSIVMGVAQNPFLNVNAMGKPLFTEPAGNPQSTSTKPLYR
jgi:hypothetical protein